MTADRDLQPRKQSAEAVSAAAKQLAVACGIGAGLCIAAENVPTGRPDAPRVAVHGSLPEHVAHMPAKVRGLAFALSFLSGKV